MRVGVGSANRVARASPPAPVKPLYVVDLSSGWMFPSVLPGQGGSYGSQRGACSGPGAGVPSSRGGGDPGAEEEHGVRELRG